MKLDFDANSIQPVYSQLKSRLRDEIATGKWQSFSKLPTVRTLASAAGVSVGTMGRVLDELVDEGLCVRRPRIGIYVNRESALAGLKTAIWLNCGRQSQTSYYEHEALALGDNELYPNCRLQSWHLSPETLRSPLFRHELERISMEHPSCLIAGASSLDRERASMIMALPFPTLFVADFPFGELRDPDLNLLREDTAERGYELVKGMHAAGCKSAALFGADLGGPYYVKPLRAGIEKAAAEFNVLIRYTRFVNEGWEEASAEELRRMKRTNLAKALEGELPDAMVFDGFTGVTEIAGTLKELGVQAGKDIKLISNRELVPGGIFVQPDYTLFRQAAAGIVNRMLREPGYQPGSIMLSGKVRYRLIAINSI